MSNRNCDGCTACCEGYLSANIHGHPMYRGKPCHFVNMDKGCTIYKDRPKEVCVPFKCAWLNDENNFFPEWVKPNVSGIIIKEMSWGPNGRFTYLNIVEYRKKITPEVLNWLINFADQNQIPIRYEVDHVQHTRGPAEFHEFINQN